MNNAPDSLAGEAYVVLRERILRGELAIGTVVSRRKLAAELGMSLVPVSEALQRLEFEGLVESRPRAGTRVRIPTEEDVRGHYVVRSALEAEAARLFAEAATPRERVELQKLAVRVDMLSIQVGGNRFQYLSLHEKLHRKIAQGTRCERLVDAIEKNHVLALTWLCAARPSRTGEVPHGHQDLIDVIVNGTPKEAAEAMRVHIASALQNTLHRLEPYFQQLKADRQTYARAASAAPAPTEPVASSAR
jgi:DNA-binding GntR family transcriptional regulator